MKYPGSVFTTSLIIAGAVILLGSPRGATALADARPAAPSIPKGEQVCLQDDTTNDTISWNTTSGDYTFIQCVTSGGVTLTGTGKVRVESGTQTLTDTESDRRISASFLTGQLTGSATIMDQYGKGMWETFTVHDTVVNPPCSCPLMSGGSDRTLFVFLALALSWFAWRIFRVRRQVVRARS
jgi:hypothetical protein